MQKALADSADPEILSLSLGLPDPSLFPSADLTEAASRVLKDNRQSLQYRLPPETLKAEICRHMAARGVECSPDQVLITNGAQQGLSLLVRLLLDPGADIFEEEFSYTAFQQIVDPFAPRITTIPSNSNSGIDVDALEESLARGLRPAFLYMMADGHNPLAVTVPRDNRQRIADLAREFHVPVIEDDPYGCLQYSAGGIPPIRAFESDWVYYVGSFSKLLAPALRVGWVVVPRSLIPPLSVVKEAADINTGTFAQWVVAEYLATGALTSHTQELCREYGMRRNAMHQALEMSLPDHCAWRVPPNGVFFWIDLPASLNATELLPIALREEKVAFLPAEAFSRGTRTNGMRLNFSRCDAVQITEACRRLGRVVERVRPA